MRSRLPSHLYARLSALDLSLQDVNQVSTSRGVAMVSFSCFAATLCFLPVLAPGPASPPKVAVYPWSFSENEKGTNQRGIDASLRLLNQLFADRLQMQVLSEAKCARAWIDTTNKVWKSTYEDPKKQPRLPSAKQLLTFGKRAGADYVCAGRLQWKVKSIWVALGPKTKATAYLDCRIVNVRNRSVELDVKQFSSDSTRAEKWYETAGSLLVSLGITVVSGGPKTPHIQRAAIKAIGGATEPFVATYGQKARPIR